MPRDVGAARARGPAPSRTPLAPPRRIEAQAGNHQIGVPAVRVDREPCATAREAPPHQPSRRKRRFEQAPAVQSVAHRSRAVVAAIPPAPVTAAVPVRLSRESVGGVDRVLHRLGSGRGRDRSSSARRQLCGRQKRGGRWRRLDHRYPRAAGPVPGHRRGAPGDCRSTNEDQQRGGKGVPRASRHESAQTNNSFVGRRG
jgi:hypothetical protein